MKLQTKLVLFNTASKVIIGVSFIVLIPFIIDKIALSQTDDRLKDMQENILQSIHKVGLQEFILQEQDISFASYNIFKEEYISIELLNGPPIKEKIENTIRRIENEDHNFRVLTSTFTNNHQNYLLEAGKSMVTVHRLNALLKKLAFIILTAVLVVFIIIDIGFTNYLIKPFNFIIEKKVRAVRHPDTFDFTPTKTTTDDFAYLDESINDMMKKIIRVFSREKEFIGNVSHELLTPISILQNRFENIISDSNTPKEIALKLVDSQKTLHRLNKIVKTLLLISRIENEQFLKEDMVDIPQLINEVIHEVEERLIMDSISISAKCERYTFHSCNKSLLYTMFFNLINNAIKYNVKNGSIYIRAFTHGNNYILEVEDTGIGMDEKEIPYIFERFKRINTVEKEGYGLGLPIVNTIADFHNLTVSVTSILHKGTLIKIIF